uniref:Nudix hydrolase domain-containing protein n=1 Tax=Pseudo-nitzschia arenysensis TaxID=697910 RepID=A0A7R9ZTJ3_9STRA|mmetsp:Transcript_1210/g.2618  ORF Transcript_1210/g.2618 Transcript_1210/m.2618 type:complete len:258 (+) Transcript_1210:121-894(+)
MGSFCSTCEGEGNKADAIIEPKTIDGAIYSTKGQSLTDLCRPLEVSQGHSLTFDPYGRLDFSKNEYRAFCLLIHRKHGALLLHCTRKKKKPPHYQLPGGHIDHSDFKQISRSLSTIITKEQLYKAARVGCAREIYEETGIDLRSRLDELLPMILHDTEQRDSTDGTLINEYKSRIFFVCEIFDDDFPYAERDGAMRFSSTRFPSLPSDFSCDLMLQLSVEHSGFRFFTESVEVSSSLKHHSGGKVEEAVKMTYSLIN